MDGADNILDEQVCGARFEQGPDDLCKLTTTHTFLNDSNRVFGSSLINFNH